MSYNRKKQVTFSLSISNLIMKSCSQVSLATWKTHFLLLKESWSKLNSWKLFSARSPKLNPKVILSLLFDKTSGTNWKRSDFPGLRVGEFHPICPEGCNWSESKGFPSKWPFQRPSTSHGSFNSNYPFNSFQAQNEVL